MLPYAVLALLILTFILLAQQFAKFSEIMGAARAPFALALEVTAYLLPSVLVFTLPMATLVGTATGFCRLGSDSELTAMRAAGIGTWRIVAPVLLLGGLISALTLEVAFDVAPSSATALRDAGLRAAIRKLESPVDPRSFYTDLPGKVIYVREGDQETGQWGGVFIYWQENAGQLRLVTARAGRIDASGEQAELALTDAQITTLPAGGFPALAAGGAVTTERSAQLRVRDDRLNSGRVALLKSMREREAEPDEMTWGQLTRQAEGAKTREQRTQAETAFHKRFTLCLAPLAFALLGAGMGLRVRRGGRALGVALSLTAMLIYYLVALAGEQLAKGGVANPALVIWLPLLLALISGGLLLRPPDGRGSAPRLRLIIKRVISILNGRASRGEGKEEGRALSNLRKPIFKGLLDRAVLSDLTRFYLGTFTALTLIFLIFTLFELLRYIVVNAASGRLVLKYLMHLLPLVSMTVAPMSMLLTVLITYSVMARRSEIIAWWGSGQSIYRIVMPSLVFAAALSFGFWALQERIMPAANRRQNQLRTQIKGGVTRLELPTGRQWLASADARRLYAYTFEASALKDPLVFEFDKEGVHLERVWWSERGESDGEAEKAGLEFVNPLVVEFRAGQIAISRPTTLRVEGERLEGFKPSLNNPAEMNSTELSAYIKSLKERQEPDAGLVVALERKRASLFDPLVMALIGAPASLLFGRRSTVVALCAAVILGVAFWGAISLFGHFGVEGMLPAKLAVWGPSFLFSVVGLYLLLRVKT